MSGESDLQTLLAGMSPALSDVPFTFASVASLEEIPASVTLLATFKEEEGVSAIAPLGDMDQAGLHNTGAWAKISLEVHSSLSAVGLTAAIATALAQEGISANIVAAYFHDHVFVRWEERHEALRVLENLQMRAE